MAFGRWKSLYIWADGFAMAAGSVCSYLSQCRLYYRHHHTRFLACNTLPLLKNVNKASDESVFEYMNRYDIGMRTLCETVFNAPS